MVSYLLFIVRVRWCPRYHKFGAEPSGDLPEGYTRCVKIEASQSNQWGGYAPTDFKTGKAFCTLLPYTNKARLGRSGSCQVDTSDMVPQISMVWPQISRDLHLCQACLVSEMKSQVVDSMERVCSPQV